MKDKILNNLGLCMRAKCLVFGTELVLEGIRKGKICYVFLANDAGNNAQKQITDKAKFYNVEVNNDYTTEELSSSVGKENKKVIGIDVKGKGFLKILRK